MVPQDWNVALATLGTPVTRRVFLAPLRAGRIGDRTAMQDSKWWNECMAWSEAVLRSGRNIEREWRAWFQQIGMLLSRLGAPLLQA